MSVLGTQHVWKPKGSSKNQAEKDNQILKNKGYISINVEKVMYHGKPTIWQKATGGKDKVAITASLVYKTQGQDDVEAKVVLKAGEVDANTPSLLSQKRYIALNVPTHAEGLEITTAIHSIKSDNFERTVDLLNDETFQTRLELDPTNIGKVLTVAKLLHRILAADSEQVELQGTFGGEILSEPIDKPVLNNALTAGYLIMISNRDKKNEMLAHFDPDLLSYDGYDLWYKKKKVDRTYIVYSIQFKPFRGKNEKTAWYAQYLAAINQLKELRAVSSSEDQQKIKQKAMSKWENGNLLLANDGTYTQQEKEVIEAKYLLEMREIFETYGGQNSFIDGNTLRIVKSELKKAGIEIAPTKGGMEKSGGTSKGGKPYAEQLFDAVGEYVQAYEDALKEYADDPLS